VLCECQILEISFFGPITPTTTENIKQSSFFPSLWDSNPQPINYKGENDTVVC
jgi:hypothetical protein